MIQGRPRRRRRRAPCRGCRPEHRAVPGSPPARWSRSAPFNPAARTSTRSSPSPGIGLGRSSTLSCPSAMTMARTALHCRTQPAGPARVPSVHGRKRDDRGTPRVHRRPAGPPRNSRRGTSRLEPGAAGVAASQPGAFAAAGVAARQGRQPLQGDHRAGARGQSGPRHRRGVRDRLRHRGAASLGGATRSALLDLDDAGGEAAASQLGGLFVHADVGRPADWARAIEQVVSELGRIDIAHLNAGVTTRGHRPDGDHRRAVSAASVPPTSTGCSSAHGQSCRRWKRPAAAPSW